MEQHNVEIEIARDGQVKIHVKGAKGERCLDYVQFFEEVVGPVTERQYTQEFYEREGKVRVDAKDVQKVAEAEQG